MNNIVKYNIKSFMLAIGIFLLLLSVCSYISAPQSDNFLQAINPWSSLAGIAFVLTYFGLPILIALAVEILLLLFIIFILFIIARHIVK